MEGLWARLVERLEYGAFVPAPAASIERVELRKRDGTPYTVLKAAHAQRGAGTYVQLEQADAELFDLMDSKRSIAEILVLNLQRRGYLALERLGRLTATLAANGFFGDAHVNVYERLRRRRAMRDPLVRLALGFRRLIVWNIAIWRNAEAAFDVIYRLGGRLAFTKVGVGLLVAAMAWGLSAWAAELAAGGRDLLRLGGSMAWGITALTAAQVLSISVHEAGHALAIRHFGRRIRGLGLAIYYLFPCLYVDSTDMVMAPRHQRVIVSLAGPAAGLLVATLAMAVVVLVEDPLISDAAFAAATLLVFQFVLNLLPVLDLDGYHVLVDALDAPLLRQRALAFVRGTAPRKLRRREPWTSDQVLLGAYGALALVTSVAMLLVGIQVWRTRLGPLAAELGTSGFLGLLLVAAIAVVFVGPLLVALAIQLVGLLRASVRQLAARLTGPDRRLDEQIRALRGVRFLENLATHALVAFADHVREERVAPGEIVVTQGEPADRFYLVREGELEAIGSDGATLNRIRSGEGFGELALLDGTPRTATVRALTPGILWSIDRGHFHRWIRDRYEVAARIRASAEERAKLRLVPFFRPLTDDELDRVASKLVLLRVPAGEDVIVAGERADRFYLIREGTAEVLDAAGERVRPLGPDQQFGEVALLMGGPRTMSVRAVSDLVLMALARHDFAALVEASAGAAEAIRRPTAQYVDVPGLGTALQGA